MFANLLNKPPKSKLLLLFIKIFITFVFMKLPAPILSKLPPEPDGIAFVRLYNPIGPEVYYLFAYSQQSEEIYLAYVAGGESTYKWAPLKDVEEFPLVIDKSFIPTTNLVEVIKPAPDVVSQEMEDGGTLNTTGPTNKKLELLVAVYSPAKDSFFYRRESLRGNVNSEVKIILEKEALGTIGSYDSIGCLTIQNVDIEVTPECINEMLYNIHVATSGDKDNNLVVFYYSINPARKAYRLELFALKFFSEKNIYKIEGIMIAALHELGIKQVSKKASFAILQPI